MEFGILEFINNQDLVCFNELGYSFMSWEEMDNYQSKSGVY